MKQLFEPVVYEDQKTLIWDYKIYTDDYYKGYYHWHQCCEIMFVHGGQGNVVVNQQMYDIRRGCYSFSSPISCTGSILRSLPLVLLKDPSSILIHMLRRTC